MEPVFHCPLSMDWPHLLPSELRPEISRAVPMVLNPCLHWSYAENDAEISALWKQRLNGIRFAPQLPICWVQHPLYLYPQAYWPNEFVCNWIHDLSAKRCMLEDLPDQLWQILVYAHVLVPPTLLTERPLEALMAWRQSLSADHCVILPQVLMPLQVAALRDYTRQFLAHQVLPEEDSSVTRRRYLYDDPVARYFHHQLRGFLSQLTGDVLRPSYNLISYYDTETVLHIHTDRSPCIWNISMALDHQPEVWGDERWPLDIWVEGGTASVRLNPGDMFLYRGRENPHGRPPLPAGHSETVVLFHFVDESYEGELG